MKKTRSDAILLFLLLFVVVVLVLHKTNAVVRFYTLLVDVLCWKSSEKLTEQNQLFHLHLSRGVCLYVGSIPRSPERAKSLPPCFRSYHRRNTLAPPGTRGSRGP